MSGDYPLVSIGMPVCNGEQFIQQALDSLLAQDYRHFELIISDNASTDRTANICQSYAAKYAQVRYYRNEENCGPVANFNRVLEYATGEYFMWAACDDVWEPTYICTMLKSLASVKGSVLAFSAFDNIDEHGNQTRTYPELLNLLSQDPYTGLLNYMTQEEYLGKANLTYGLMRKETIEKAGGFKLWGGYWGCDMLVVFRILLMGNMVIYPGILFHKRLLSPEPKNKNLLRILLRILDIPATISSYRRWHSYFSGYARIISLIDRLPESGKARLQGALHTRAKQVYWRVLKGA